MNGKKIRGGALAPVKPIYTPLAKFCYRREAVLETTVLQRTDKVKYCKATVTLMQTYNLTWGTQWREKTQKVMERWQKNYRNDTTPFKYRRVLAVTLILPIVGGDFEQFKTCVCGCQWKTETKIWLIDVWQFVKDEGIYLALLKAQFCMISFQPCTQIVGIHKALIHVKR